MDFKLLINGIREITGKFIVKRRLYHRNQPDRIAIKRTAYICTKLNAFI